MTEKYENVFEQVKKEFFGIDKQIEMILKSIETWDYTREYIKRPIIFNVIGMTGVGKTAVINRILELLDLEEKKVYFKFNNKTTDVVESLRNNNMSDSIFMFDEFQYLRTINEKSDEIRDEDHKGFNIVWDLLDSGEVVLQNSDYFYFGIGRINMMLDDFISNGLKYERGVFVGDAVGFMAKKYQMTLSTQKSMDSYLKHVDYCISTANKTSIVENPNLDMEIGYDSEYGEDKFMPKEMYSYTETGDEQNYITDRVTLRSMLPVSIRTMRDAIKNISSKHKYPTTFDLERELYLIKDIEGLIDYFDQFKNNKPLPTKKNFKNSLIITISNIDEAYRAAHKVDSDIDADLFYKETSKIGMLTIRKALLSRFRPEQVARFGGNYILYPSLNKNAFEMIIQKEIDKFKEMVTSSFDGKDGELSIKNINVSSNVNKIIYLEGVFPIIGARSVFSAVNDIVNDKFSKIVMNVISIKEKHREIDIDIDYKKGNIIIKYTDSGTSEAILEESVKYELKVDNLRREKKKDIGKQVHRAIHECGHAICSIMLRNIVPEVIYSTVINSSGAFNMFNEDDFYYERKNTYLDNVAVSMGGYAAELVVFGSQNLSNGSSSDINKATSLLMNLYKDCGFLGSDMAVGIVSNQMPATPFTDRNYSVVDLKNEVDTIVVADVRASIEKAKGVIKEQEMLLLKMGEYLSKNPKMGRRKIIEMIKKYSVNYDISKIDSNKNNFYVEILNQKLKEVK